MPDLCVIPGDGIGKEVIPAAVEVLEAVVPNLRIIRAEAGWECFQTYGISVPQGTLDKLRVCSAGLFGAVSSPSRKVEGYRSAILVLRQSLDLYANLRPVWSLPGVSPRPDVNLMVVRENTEGMYSGKESSDGERAVAQRVITRQASLRIGRLALEVCRDSGRKKLTIVHKANVLPLTDGLFRDCIHSAVEEFARDGFEIKVEELLVDIAAMKMVAEPENYDVIVTTNLFGDILSDAAAYWCGGMGLAPSINLGETVMLAEPVHGSAPDIAGMGIANPIAAVLSSAMLVKYKWKMDDVSNRIIQAVEKTTQQVPLLLNGRLPAGMGTQEMTKTILRNL